LISACDEGYSEFIKVFVKKEEIWSEIKVDSNKKLDEQVKTVEHEAKMSLYSQIINN